MMYCTEEEGREGDQRKEEGKDGMGGRRRDRRGGGPKEGGREGWNGREEKGQEGGSRCKKEQESE